MSTKLPKRVVVEVVKGVEGYCLCVGNAGSAFRISGPKPWGGGDVVHSFTVDAAELIKTIREYAQ